MGTMKSFLSSVYVSLFILTTAQGLWCPKHEYNLDDQKCCTKCQPGYGVVQLCSFDSDTECATCDHSVTFSRSLSHSELCRPCTVCGENSYVNRPCNITHDTECLCDRGFYWSHTERKCTPCSLCPHGYGMSRLCFHDQNTECRQCPQGTYNGIVSATQACIMCSVCDKGTQMLQECTSIQDTICSDQVHGLHHRRSTEKPNKEIIFNFPDDQAARQSIIPLYCGLLGIVILGLVAYVAVRHWRLKRSSRKAGVYYGGISLLESEVPFLSKHTSSVAPQGGTELVEMPSYTSLKQLQSSKRKEIEHLLNKQDNANDWRVLARNLGYTATRISVMEESGKFKRGGPTRCLFNDWSKHPNSSVENLIHHLKSIQRHDAVRVLYPYFISQKHLPRFLKGDLV